jgi:Zn-dependent metalloprotease
MSVPITAQSNCGCCFIVPPEVLKELSRGQKITPPDARMFQDSFLETMRLRNIREGHRVASLITRRSTVFEAAPPHQTDQHIFDCRNRTSLPGRPVGNPSTGAAGFQTVSKTTGQVADFYSTVLNRNSVDDRGMDLVSSLNYSRNYQNAFWNGQQMVYGNGDQHIFIDFWKSPDVIGHELTHGVTQNESGLRYEGESGALNESLSDCFGAAFNQWVTKSPASKDDGWLIGAGIMGPTAAAKGYSCLRDMVNPGAQHCLSPQPASYANFDPTADVHINSGIPNRAFALFARAVGGNAYDSPIKLWYSACTGGHLSSSATIAQFARSTIDAADRWTGTDKDKLAKAVRDAWHTVEVPLPFV